MEESEYIDKTKEEGFHMGKKWIAWILSVLMLISCATAFAEEAPETEKEIPQELIRQMGYSAAEAVTMGVNPADIVYYDHLTVGNTTPMHGDFFTEMWGNATSDADVRNLLHADNLIWWNGEIGAFAANPAAVTGIVATENPAKDRTYTFVLNENLRYSDGSKITAWDYAFSFLLLLSPEIEGAGAVPMRSNYILGSEAYRSGTSAVLTGVHVTADDIINVTLDHEYLPFFYEMGLLSCNPYPIRVIAPGVTVKDDGQGVYLANEDETVTQPLFTTELLNRTLNDPAAGYRTHPSVVSGPYVLTRFDGETAEFDANPYFGGNASGEMPLIPHLTYRHVQNDTMVDLLLNGELDVINKATNAQAVTRGMNEISGGKIQMSNYPRSGMSYLAFACERPTVSSPGVRRAIAYCMDRDAVVSDYTGNFGLRTDGYYGVGQWMYSIVNGTLEPPVTPPENTADTAAQADYEKELEEWKALNLDSLIPYTLDTEKAASLLNEEGWWVNADGLREKVIDGQTVVLDLTLAYAEGNRIAEAFEKYLVPNLAEIGVRLTLRPVPQAEITRIAHSGEARDVDMFYQAANFDLIYDPAAYFAPADTGEESWSFTRQKDGVLYDLALAMRETEPGEMLQYMKNWIAFQERFNDQLPMIPIYSNVYFDFFTSLLHDYTIAENSPCPEAILGAVKADIPVIETGSTDNTGAQTSPDGTMEIGDY